MEPLLAAAHDPSSEVRRGAIGVLASIDDERAFDVVARFVRQSGEGEESYRSASNILHTLAMRHGERALPLLREMAFGNDPWRWLMATTALPHLGASAVPLLLEMVHDPRPERRHNSFSWLKIVYRRSPDPRIVDFLFGVIQENPDSAVDEHMRYHATLALGECGDPRAVEPLLEILQNAARHLMVRSSVVWHLGELGDERTLEALTAIFEESKTWESGVEDGQSPERELDFDGFQEALLKAIAKIRKRLSTMEAATDSTGTSAAT
ncbi:MAG TPA: HEAT repeat domain-containing protein [Ktedonobacterales bacterium]|nr:HEAT repeat domain-containing protein [Ktedonobacterales bacterium]